MVGGGHGSHCAEEEEGEENKKRRVSEYVM